MLLDQYEMSSRAFGYIAISLRELSQKYRIILVT